MYFFVTLEYLEYLAAVPVDLSPKLELINITVALSFHRVTILDWLERTIVLWLPPDIFLNLSTGAGGRQPSTWPCLMVPVDWMFFFPQDLNQLA
jgi:hypothetical protein